MNGYYIVSSATQSVSGKKYACRLHTYAQISNVSDYFAAVNGPLMITHGVDAANGQVYGLSINFKTDGPIGTQTIVRKAEFVKSADITAPSLIPPLNWDSATKSLVVRDTTLTYVPIAPVGAGDK